MQVASYKKTRESISHQPFAICYPPFALCYNPRMTNLVQPHDVALLISRDHKRFLIRLVPGEQLHTHRGIIQHDACIGGEWGREMLTHLNYPFLLLDPSTADLIQDIKRTTNLAQLYAVNRPFIINTDLGQRGRDKDYPGHLGPEVEGENFHGGSAHRGRLPLHDCRA